MYTYMHMYTHNAYPEPLPLRQGAAAFVFGLCSEGLCIGNPELAAPGPNRKH